MSDIANADAVTVVAIFTDIGSADQATRRLSDAGIPESSISRVSGTAGAGSEAGTDTGAGMGSGAQNAMYELGVPDEDVGLFADSADQGDVVIAVTDIETDTVAVVIDVLESAGAVDLNAREQARADQGIGAGRSGTRQGEAAGGEAMSETPQLTRQEGESTRVRAYAGPERERVPVGGTDAGAEAGAQGSAQAGGGQSGTQR